MADKTIQRFHAIVSVAIFCLLLQAAPAAMHATSPNSADARVTVNKRLFQSNGWGPSGWPWPAGRLLLIPSTAVDGLNGGGVAAANLDEDTVRYYLQQQQDLAADDGGFVDPRPAMRKRLFQSKGWGPSGWRRFDASDASEGAADAAAAADIATPITVIPTGNGDGLVPPRRHARFTDLLLLRNNNYNDALVGNSLDSASSSTDADDFQAPPPVRTTPFFSSYSRKLWGAPRLNPALLAATMKSRYILKNKTNKKAAAQEGDEASGAYNIASVPVSPYHNMNQVNAFPKTLARLRAARFAKNNK